MRSSLTALVGRLSPRHAHKTAANGRWKLGLGNCHLNGQQEACGKGRCIGSRRWLLRKQPILCRGGHEVLFVGRQPSGCQIHHPGWANPGAAAQLSKASKANWLSTALDRGKFKIHSYIVGLFRWNLCWQLPATCQHLWLMNLTRSTPQSSRPTNARDLCALAAHSALTAWTVFVLSEPVFASTKHFAVMGSPIVPKMMTVTRNTVGKSGFKHFTCISTLGYSQNPVSLSAFALLLIALIVILLGSTFCVLRHLGQRSKRRRMAARLEMEEQRRRKKNAETSFAGFSGDSSRRSWNSISYFDKKLRTSSFGHSDAQIADSNGVFHGWRNGGGSDEHHSRHSPGHGPGEWQLLRVARIERRVWTWKMVLEIFIIVGF